MEMEQIVFETSAYKIQTPGNYQEESIQMFPVVYDIPIYAQISTVNLY